jgi:3-dehydroquinate synthase
MSELAIGPGLLNLLGTKMREAGLTGRAFLVSDDVVFPLFGEAALAGLREGGFEVASHQMPDGERTKSLAGASAIYDWLAEQRAERGDTIVALGGGVVGDVAGFVAATYLRGMPLVQVPTTVLGQIDSAIGGKVAVDHPRGKNLIGAFYPARLIVADIDTLRTLPPRQLAAGWAEAVKCAMVLDADLLDLLETHAVALRELRTFDPEGELLRSIVERCARHKVAVVAEDERETGLRMILNYGHTIGHALEAALSYETLLHGEAVSIGMAGAAAMSVARGLLDPAAAECQNRVLARFGLPTRFPGDLPAPAPEVVLDRMASDKKARGARLRWILLDRIGHARIESDVPMTLVRDTVAELLRPGVIA